MGVGQLYTDLSTCTLLEEGPVHVPVCIGSCVATPVMVGIWTRIIESNISASALHLQELLSLVIVNISDFFLLHWMKYAGCDIAVVAR